MSILLANMFGEFQWVIIALVVLLLFGNRLPSVMRSMGEGVSEFKKGIAGIDDQDTGSHFDQSGRIDQPRIDERDRLVGNGSRGGTVHAKLAITRWANAAPRPPTRRSLPRPPSRPARG